MHSYLSFTFLYTLLGLLNSLMSVNAHLSSASLHAQNGATHDPIRELRLPAQESGDCLHCGHQRWLPQQHGKEIVIVEEHLVIRCLREIEHRVLAGDARHLDT